MKHHQTFKTRISKAIGIMKKGYGFFKLAKTHLQGVSYIPKLIRCRYMPSWSEMRLLVDPWYHDFGVLGFKTYQIVEKVPGGNAAKLNQRCKQKPIFKLIRRAISLCKEKGLTTVRGVELFCADGFFANYSVQAGADEMEGVDRDKREIYKARLITKLLGNATKISFEEKNVFDITGEYDFCICAGGLYHISNPYELLKKLHNNVRVALVIQTVYSLANESPNYFETPAPGWTWGCRFSYDYLTKMICDSGWMVIDKSTNQLTGNSRLEDRGSAYLLCVPTNNHCEKQNSLHKVS